MREQFKTNRLTEPKKAWSKPEVKYVALTPALLEMFHGKHPELPALGRTRPSVDSGLEEQL